MNKTNKNFHNAAASGTPKKKKKLKCNLHLILKSAT